ncbi:hypothetical protein THAOC_10321 [Thalassiosira oceanica]|uniref:NAA35-like TPR repeats domain-containing protein n=1 Tax=Thalassiosira oceanica TaxID=159749 RepID=K0SU43_THAOC|nr:hypothetical protein THAOC_10321 [Thalassiosira oceanica]|eukprot:EJK68489.1 hypothetical protein THAOC_10321 [Thalassiosira oceanica]
MVIEFTRLAAQKSREAEGLIQTMHTCPAMLELMNIEIVDTVGRLQPTESEVWDGLLSASFDPFVNRRLLGNTPVRKSCFRRLKSVLESLSSMSNELRWGVCDLILQGDTLSRIMRMLEGNSMRGCPPFAIPKKEPEGTPFGLNILSRSLLVLNLYFDDQLFGQHDLGDLIASQMISWGVPELLLDIKYDDKPFMARLVKPIYDTLKALCFNRQREITYIESILLPAFQNLQYEAAVMDDSFREKYKLDVRNTSPYASNFVIMHTLRLMERYLALQCEVGLYTHPHDLQVVYWYRDFLLSAHVSVRGEIARDKSVRSAMELQIGNGEKKEISEQGDTIKMQEFEVEDRIEMTALILKRNISRGLVRYMSVLQQVGLLRFKRRFWAFKQLPQPPCLTIDDFHAGTDFYSLSSKEVIESASDCFRSSKNIVDQLLEVIVPPHETEASRMSINQRFDNDPFIAIHRDEILALAKVCVGNSLYLHKLASMVSSQTDLSNCNKVSVEHKVHRQFCQSISKGLVSRFMCRFCMYPTAEVKRHGQPTVSGRQAGMQAGRQAGRQADHPQRGPPFRLSYSRSRPRQGLNLNRACRVQNGPAEEELHRRIHP